jgi:endonuclease YncB( thermonuclease family)
MSKSRLQRVGRIGILTLGLILLNSDYHTLRAERSFGDVDSVHVDTVVDGDTFKVSIPGWPPIVGDSISIRVAGINCAELKAKLKDSLNLALEAKEFTRAILGKAGKVSLGQMRRGIYFRITADVYVDGINLADTLVRAGLASRADPDHKRDFVYAIRKGDRFHRQGCRHLNTSGITMTLTREDAADMGYLPCSRCKP